MELEKEQFRVVALELRPDWTDEQFDAHWQDFVQLKRSVQRGRNKQIHKMLK